MEQLQKKQQEDKGDGRSNRHYAIKLLQKFLFLFTNVVLYVYIVLYFVMHWLRNKLLNY